MQLIIDGDPIVYRAGFAGQKVDKNVVYYDPHMDEPIDLSFTRTENKTANKLFNEWHEAHGYDILDEWEEVIPEPLDHVLATVRHMIRDCITATAKHFNLDVFDITYRVILSGPGNFRNEVATVRPYKGNRKEDNKPYWYQQIRNYMTEQWDAEVVEGREADDECSILARRDPNAIICTIDKDLDQVPGWHYDYWRQSFYFTAPTEGEVLFYKQVLQGDSTDNIPGAYKIGKVTAAKITEEVILEHGMDHMKIWDAIVDTYQSTLDTHGEACPYYGMEAEAVAIEMARLVKMQEYPGQLWTPPGQEDELLELEFEE